MCKIDKILHKKVRILRKKCRFWRKIFNHCEKNGCGDASSDYKIGLSITLDIEKGGQITMVDPHLRLFCNDRFGVERYACACQLQHAEVIGAVSDRDRILG